MDGALSVYRDFHGARQLVGRIVPSPAPGQTLATASGADAGGRGETGARAQSGGSRAQGATGTGAQGKAGAGAQADDAAGAPMPCVEGRFSYDLSYMQGDAPAPIGTRLRLRPSPFSEDETRLFFSELAPGGLSRKMLAAAIGAPQADYMSMLARLGFASAGALMFCPKGEQLPEEGRLDAVHTSDLESFAAHPHILGVRMAMRSHLALGGGQFKLALFHEGDDAARRWYLPALGTPSTHIVKAPDDAHPGHTLNEALCMRTARLLGLHVADSALIALTAREPLLAVRRFDRPYMAAPALLDGHELPARLHQEDFCQAAGIFPAVSGQPGPAGGLGQAMRIINATAGNPLSARIRFFKRLLFSFIIGNCDNGFKKHALLWDADWKRCMLAPAYDLACTTIYDDEPRVMDIGLGKARIDDVRADDIRAAGAQCGVGERLAWDYYGKLCRSLPGAVEQAAREIEELGFRRVRHIAGFIARDAARRSFA